MNIDIFFFCSLCVLSAAGRPREGSRADQQGREPALLPASGSVEPLPGVRCAQPPHPLLSGPGAPHTQGESHTPSKAALYNAQASSFAACSLSNWLGSLSH